MNQPSSLRNLRRAVGLVLLAALLDLSSPDSVWSQQQLPPPLPTPRLLVVGPNGAKAGTTAEFAFSGENLDTADGLIFSVPGVKSELVSAPPTPDIKKGGRQQQGTAIDHGPLQGHLARQHAARHP